MFEQHRQGIVEEQPFRDSDGELALAFDFFKDLEIIPGQFRVLIVRIVLYGSDAAASQFLQSGFNGLPAPIVIWFGNDRSHRLARGFADDAGSLTCRITIDLAACRILAGNRDTRQLQGARVGHRDVSVHAFEEHGMILGHFIDVPAAGKFFHRPQSLVPTPAHNPLVRTLRFERASESDRETQSATSLPPGQP